jgi:Flp pilus assembly protein TadG
MMMLGGLWQIGRFVEVHQVLWNAARESARNASLGQNNLKTIASSMLIYLENAESTAFNSAHSMTIVSPVVSLPANTTGYTCWDNTTNEELFTITFTDITNPSTTDPTGMSQLDLYKVGIQVPFATVRCIGLMPIANMTRLYATVAWASMVDTPYQIPADIPAE